MPQALAPVAVYSTYMVQIESIVFQWAWLRRSLVCSEPLPGIPLKPTKTVHLPVLVAPGAESGTPTGIRPNFADNSRAHGHALP
jgi:hypothetical protein